MKTCLVSFSSRGREDYNSKLLRLLDSNRQNWGVETILYSPDHPLLKFGGVYHDDKINEGYPWPQKMECFSHAEMPYQFKIALIEEARQKGFERVAWLDSSMIICKDLTPLFDEKTGITVFHNLGHPLKNYIADHACKLLDVREKELEQIPQIWGGALFFDFTVKNARRIFEQIKQHSVNGSFKNGTSTRPGFVAHRHDQAVISVLVNGKCKMLPYGNIVCPPHDTNGEYGNDFYLICK